MNHATIIAKKELRSYFNSPAAYIILVGFLLIGGWFFASPLFIRNQAELRSLFSIVPIIYIFFVPAITMGLIAREKNNGTIEQLTTFPLDNHSIIMGKFWASLALITVGLVFTLVHFFTIVTLGSNLDYGAIFCGYLGLILLGGVYSSIGIFTSSLTSNQIVASIIAFCIIFALYMIEFVLVFLPASLAEIMQYISTGYHFQNLARGVIDSRNVIYYLSLIVLFLRMATIALQARK
jgi:ABC-2 type transport system permease protein